MLRLGLVPDFREENWPSMDLAADMLFEKLRDEHADEIACESLCPTFKKRFMRLPSFGKPRALFNADRFLNRMRHYPRHLKRVRHRFDCFHVCDHAYANTVHALPANQTGVFCHDLDTFRCLFDPQAEPRPRWFKSMMRRVLDGLQKAAMIFHTTQEIRRQIVAHGIADESRLVQAACGVSEIFTPDDVSSRAEEVLLAPLKGAPFVLHVGSCIPRKRIDVLLDVFARLRQLNPDLKLVQVPDEWTSPQREQIERLNLGEHIFRFGRQEHSVIAGLYRRARLVLLPSDAEGFGLPVAEALACGAVMVASEIPTLMEVGGEAAVYCPVADIESWAGTIHKILQDPNRAPPRDVRLRQAAKYSWSTQAQIICDAYLKLARVG